MWQVLHVFSVFPPVTLSDSVNVNWTFKWTQLSPPILELSCADSGNNVTQFLVAELNGATRTATYKVLPRLSQKDRHRRGQYLRVGMIARNNGWTLVNGTETSASRNPIAHTSRAMSGTAFTRTASTGTALTGTASTRSGRPDSDSTNTAESIRGGGVRFARKTPTTTTTRKTKCRSKAKTK